VFAFFLFTTNVNQMTTDTNTTPAADNGENLTDNQTPPVEVVQTYTTTGKPAVVDEVKQDVATPTQTNPKKEVKKTVEEKPSTAKKRISYTTNLSEEQDNYLKPIVADLINFGVCETQSDFVAKAIDFYVNYQAVCKEMGRVPTLMFPIPDGRDGSIAIEHKLLKQSLFTPISKLPTV
jgi:hypothetical protein